MHHHHSHTDYSKSNYRFQFWILVVGVLLFVLKMAAWKLTDSNAIFSDAMESIVNIVTGFIGLYSLYLSAQPSDKNHPYGHGKAEFVSAAIEGTLILVAAVLIFYKAILGFIYPPKLEKLDIGLILIVITSIGNFVMGFIAVQKGKKSSSLALQASGKHLITDTYSTIGIAIALGLVFLTNWSWLDSVISIIVAVIISFSGYAIIRSSLAGIMDEADEELLKNVVNHINENRKPSWIDIHNIRIIKYGAVLHIDCHMTVPWFYTVLEAHDQIKELEMITQSKFGDHVELFVHLDSCKTFSCHLCSLADCKHRKNPFVKQIPWTVENVSLDKQHH